jgi:CRP-like cAMP-binding protein
MISPELLRRFPFFGFMNDEELKAVAMVAEEYTYLKGEEIIKAGDEAAALFFLLEGDVGYYFIVTSEHDPYFRDEHFVQSINPGEIFGISALIEPYKYTANLCAEKPSRAIKIDARALRALCEVDLKLSCGLNRAVAKAAMERLQSTRAQLVAAAQKT